MQPTLDPTGLCTRVQGDTCQIASSNWGDHVKFQDTVHQRLGNQCDVLVFTPAEFSRLATAGEPVVTDIVRDGVAPISSMPRVRRGAA